MSPSNSASNCASNSASYSASFDRNLMAIDEIALDDLVEE